MSGTDGEEEFKGLDCLDGEEDLGLFGDLSAFEGLGIEEEVGIGEQSSDNGSPLCPHCLGKYKNPRVLSCLHVLCEMCLKELLLSPPAADSDDGEEISLYSSRSGKNKTGLITCPQCKQETMVGERGISSLPIDPVYQKLSGVEVLSGLICTGCKANEEAMAKCIVCDNLLCANCNTAHKYMRLFESHKVVTFEELSQSGQLASQLVKKSPAGCPRHPTESFKFYCFTCQMMICSQCLKNQHSGLDHRTEHLSDAEARCREELAHFSQEMSARQNSCRSSANRLEKMLGELQQQHDAARAAVDQMHRQYLALLDKKKEQAFEELAALHTKQELGVMEACERVDRTRDRIQTAMRYTKQVLDEAEAPGLLSLHGCIKSQMQLLHNAATRPDDGVQVLLKFESNLSRFEDSLNSSYGYVVNPSMTSSGGGGSSGSSSAGVASKPVSSLGLPTPSSTPQPPSPTHSSPLDGSLGVNVCGSNSGNGVGGYTNLLSPHLGPSLLMKNDLSTIGNNSHSALLNALAPSVGSLGPVGPPVPTSMGHAILGDHRERRDPRDHMQSLHSHSHAPVNMASFASGGGFNPVPSMSSMSHRGLGAVDPLSAALDSHLASVASGMTSIQEYNLQRLASLASAAGKPGHSLNECQNSMQQQHHHHQQQQHLLQRQQSHPSSNRQSQSSPIQQQHQQHFTLADFLSGDMNATSQALSNLQALAKLGSQNSLGLNLSLDGGSSHMGGSGGAVGGGHGGGIQGMGTNLGLLVNGSSSSSSSSPLEASLMASALGAAPFVPSASVNLYGSMQMRQNQFKRTSGDISSSSSSSSSTSSTSGFHSAPFAATQQLWRH